MKACRIVDERKTRRRLKSLPAAIAMAALLATVQAQDSATTLKQETAISLEKVEGRIDHMAVDLAGQRLFVAALGNNTVEVLDLKAGKTIQSLPGFAEPQGIVYVAEFDKLFVANGSDGTCRVLDGRSFKGISKVKLGDDADNVRYDEGRKRVYVGYGSGVLAAIDAKTDKRVGDIKLSGHPESFRLASGGPNIFVNVPKADCVAVVDRDKGTVIATWPLKEAKSNFPMSLDEANQRMFVGCRSPATVMVYDYSAGRQVASVAISNDTDDLFYDSDKKLVYVSCGSGVIEIIKQLGPDHYTKIRTVSTAAGARTSLFIPELKLFCLAVPHRGSKPAEVRVYRTE
jgi:DNA-binding beta-propeller fold protein YncE